MDRRTIPFDWGEAAIPEPRSARVPPSPPAPRPRDDEPPPSLPESVRPESVRPDATPPESVRPRAPESTRESPLTVADLGRRLGAHVTRAFPNVVWISGEVAEARAGSTGHVYFTLKDESEDATLDAVAYRSNLTQTMRNALVRGAKILIRGRPTYWVPRGRVQFICERVELSGEGMRLLALEELKKKLAAEGLFAKERKRRLPRDPRRIGVVSSKHGAVIHDISRVAFRRGGASILLASATVQGNGAAESVIHALTWLQRVNDVDVIIIARGGGSSEDLACFNDESVARAVAACRVPVVSAVGHDVDVTLTDYVADARAATPSQGAELVVRDRPASLTLLGERKRRLLQAMDARARRARHELTAARHELSDPRLALAMYAQRLEQERTQLLHAIRERVSAHERDVERARTRLARHDPRAVVRRTQTALTEATARLHRRFAANVGARRAALGALAARLEAMSPLAVLGRGYAIALVGDSVITDAEQVRPGDDVRVRLAQGEIAARVTSAKSGPNGGDT